MSQLGVWGDSIAFRLLASCYSVIFFVVTSLDGSAYPREYPPVQRNRYTRTDVYFIYLANSHFEILDPFGPWNPPMLSFQIGSHFLMSLSYTILCSICFHLDARYIEGGPN
jgi:hypothetical protein